MMMVSGSRRRQIGWLVVLVACAALLAGLTFKVNTIKSQVRLAERQIIALETEKRILEIEFQARSSQQQLADWNRVEYGYVAPSAGQYLESERQLAELGMARPLGAPEPIRVAQAAVEEDGGVLAMVSPLTGKPVAAAASGSTADGDHADAGRDERRADRQGSAPSPRSLSERLARPAPAGRANLSIEP